MGKVEAKFLSGPAPTARLVGPSRELAAERRPLAESAGSAGSGPCHESAQQLCKLRGEGGSELGATVELRRGGLEQRR